MLLKSIKSGLAVALLASTFVAGCSERDGFFVSEDTMPDKRIEVSGASGDAKIDEATVKAIFDQPNAIKPILYYPNGSYRVLWGLWYAYDRRLVNSAALGVTNLWPGDDGIQRMYGDKPSDLPAEPKDVTDLLANKKYSNTWMFYSVKVKNSEIFSRNETFEGTAKGDAAYVVSASGSGEVKYKLAISTKESDPTCEVRYLVRPEYLLAKQILSINANNPGVILFYSKLAAPSQATIQTSVAAKSALNWLAFIDLAASYDFSSQSNFSHFFVLHKYGSPKIAGDVVVATDELDASTTGNGPMFEVFEAAPIQRNADTQRLERTISDFPSAEQVVLTYGDKNYRFTQKYIRHLNAEKVRFLLSKDQTESTKLLTNLIVNASMPSTSPN